MGPVFRSGSFHWRFLIVVFVIVAVLAFGVFLIVRSIVRLATFYVEANADCIRQYRRRTNDGASRESAISLDAWPNTGDRFRVVL